MIGERDWLPKRRLSLDYLYIIRLKALLCCIWLWEARGVPVGIDNKANRFVCDKISEVLRNSFISVSSSYISWTTTKIVLCLRHFYFQKLSAARC
jgi:hypothetical protein